MEKIMKLLIVDDEELTRTGVVSSVDWDSLGITQVIQADDGLNGLAAARQHKPEIVLCDVRMPRMDGITMLERLEEFLPDSVPIFMSGYSDKEYLKAAIKLKAVNYIEKPIDPKEIYHAVQEAQELYRQKQSLRHGETLHSMETAARLALQLTVPYGGNSGDIDLLSRELSLSLSPNTYFTAFILKLDVVSELDELARGEIYHRFKEYLASFHLDCIYVEKRLRYLVYFVFGPGKLSLAQMQSVGNFLVQQYSILDKYFIAAGDSLPGIQKAYHSYASAVILLQSSFFFSCNTFLHSGLIEHNDTENKSPPFPDSPEDVFANALSSKNKDACIDFLKQLKDCCYKNKNLLQNQVKDLYYKLFHLIEGTRKQLMIPSADMPQESIVDAMENCFTFLELHEALTERTEAFFQDTEKTVQENPTIFLIKEYISQNYMKETLSVKDISSHVFLSTSYVCTFFKNETGQTLNQYLTEYRMERAKLLLSDPRYKITDISSKVGYSDGNYFGKSFKKYSGLSPSEYREKMIQ